MMSFDINMLRQLTNGSDQDAWQTIIQNAIQIASKPLAQENASSEIIKRDREIGGFDHFLSSGGWDLWQSFGNIHSHSPDGHECFHFP
jgi:hypothetical protein